MRDGRPLSRLFFRQGFRFRLTCSSSRPKLPPMPQQQRRERQMKPRGYAAIGLHQPKTPVNVGSVLRAAGVYGAALVATSGQRYSRAPTDTMKAYRHLPLVQCQNLRDVIPFDCVPVAVDLIDGARPLHRYIHPERAFYVFGPEDGTLGKEILSWCRDVVYVPTDGCMNLAATVNVILYDRQAKQLI